MANTDWTKLEGRYFKVDIGTSRAEALKDTSDDSVLHICSDGAIVMNGEVIAERMVEATFNEATGAYTYGSISGEDLHNAKYAYEKVCRLVTSTADKPAIKATNNGDDGYYIGIWQDGETYNHGATIPVVTKTANGIMSAEVFSDVADIYDWWTSFDESKYLAKTDAQSTYMPLAGGTFTGAVTFNKDITADGTINANNIYFIPISTTTGRSYRRYFKCAVSGTQYYAYTELGTDRVLNTDGTYLAFKVTKPLLVGSKAAYVDTVTSVFMNNVVVGSSSVSRNVTVNGTVTASSLVQSTTSDERMKENLNADFNAVEKLSSLGEVYAFDYKNEAHSHSYGLIAQNVLQNEEFSDMVGQREEDGMYYVNYLDPRLTALLIKSVKQLKAELEELRTQIARS